MAIKLMTILTTSASVRESKSLKSCSSIDTRLLDYDHRYDPMVGLIKVIEEKNANMTLILLNGVKK